MFDFGLRIRELREARNMSQEALGARVGRSKPVISSYENNLKTPPVDVLVKIANVFDVSLDYLVGLDQKRNISTEGMTREQIGIMNMICLEFKEKKYRSGALSMRQQRILSDLLVQFLSRYD